MSKNDLMKIKKFKDFERELIKIGYIECSAHGGSHRIFKAPNKPTLSIPCHNNSSEIAPGTRRNIIKLILA
jgi:predicted RNA binding protein YcfA (HicA-like mRNA interferase family)